MSETYQSSSTAGASPATSNRRSPSACSRGFTLIEVMVVVAIIALLVSIMLPSLKSARATARSAKCASNMSQAIKGVNLRMAEDRAQNVQWSTNFGWATSSLKSNKGFSEIFVCPDDPAPRPVPAVFARLYNGGKYQGTTSGDAIFNRIRRVAGGNGDRWQTDIQDQLANRAFGGDAYGDPDGDLIFEYAAKDPSQKLTVATNVGNERAWRFSVESYEGKLLHGEDPSGSGAPSVGWSVNVHLLWMSYGANANSGLRNVTGSPAFIVEAGKLGLFPDKLGEHEADNLAWALRFRHGGGAAPRGLKGMDYTKTFKLPPTQPDQSYVPQDKMNVGFLDGHVENLGHWQIFDLDKSNPEGTAPMPKHNLWRGSVTGGATTY